MCEWKNPVIIAVLQSPSHLFACVCLSAAHITLLACLVYKFDVACTFMPPRAARPLIVATVVTFALALASAIPANFQMASSHEPRVVNSGCFLHTSSSQQDQTHWFPATPVNFPLEVSSGETFPDLVQLLCFHQDNVLRETNVCIRHLRIVSIIEILIGFLGDGLDWSDLIWCDGWIGFSGHSDLKKQIEYQTSVSPVGCRTSSFRVAAIHDLILPQNNSNYSDVRRRQPWYLICTWHWEILSFVVGIISWREKGASFLINVSFSSVSFCSFWTTVDF